MTRRLVSPFSLGLTLGLLVIGIGLFTSVFYVHQALALSRVGSDNTDFPPSSHYTLSNTVDVANATTMSVAVFIAGAKPAGNTTVAITYQVNVAAGPACDVNNHQGWAGVTFSGTGVVGSGNAAAAGIPTRQTTVTIQPGAWVADGTGFKAVVNGALVNMTHNCGAAGGDGNHVNFTMTAPTSYILGPAGGKRFAVTQGTYKVVFNSTYPGGVSGQGYTTYNVPFAPPCTLAANQDVSALIYDMDNTGHPVIQPTRAVVKIIDTTGGGNTVINDDNFTGGEGNGQTATFPFTVKPQHTYKMQISNVNLNNILQMQIPFDSVNAVINCLPKGGITSSTTAACTDITGWMYDQNNPGTPLRLYVYTNPASTPAATYASAPADSHFWGQFSANLANPPGTPAGTPANHGFDVTTQVQIGAAHGYNGPWVDNIYYVYAVDLNTGALQQIGSKDVPAGTCANVSCGSSNFAVDTVGSPDTFTVSMKLNGATTAPPGPPTFTVKVTGTGAGTNSQTFSGVAGTAPSGGSITSTSVTFTPTGAGAYTVSWSYFGTNCGGTPSDAGYTPFFGVKGGDIVAGSGFGNGSCAETPSDIKSVNTDAPTFFGAGSEMGALATGSITDFVSGMGLGGGAPSLSGHGLSFANSNNSQGNTPPNYGGGFGAGNVACIDDYYGTKAAASPSNLGPYQLTNGVFNGLSGAYTATPGGPNNAVEIGNPAHVGVQLAAGQTVTLYVQGNVYIESNITYAPYALTSVPRFNLYVSGNIYIDPQVTELHGVFIAQKSSASPSGNITTCSEGVNDNGTEPYGICKNPLLVVGAMAAEGQLRLSRTHGNLVGVPAAGVAAEPAETFQYGPELWLNAPPLTDLTVKAYTSLPPVL